VASSFTNIVVTYKCKEIKNVRYTTNEGQMLLPMRDTTALSQSYVELESCAINWYF